jgi:GT2 family glycosyltransferase
MAETLGVAVLAYGGGGEHGPLIGSLLAEGIEPGAIVVVHNPAQPGEPAPPVAAGCELLQTGKNLGYTGGMNIGIARLRERGVDLVLLLTHDARLRPGALAALLGAGRAHPAYGVLGPALVLTGTETPFSFGGITRANGTNAHIHDPDRAEGELLGCDWVDGGTMLIRRPVLDQVGDFDEGFWGYCEEADLCLRVRRAGYGVGVVLTAIADQDPGGGKRPGPWAYLITRNGIAFARRAAGIYGLVTVAGRAAFIVAAQLGRLLTRTVRPRPGGRAEPWALAVGTGRGIVDYFRGRWGPPPADLPGTGDLHNA